MQKVFAVSLFAFLVAMPVAQARPFIPEIRSQPLEEVLSPHIIVVSTPQRAVVGFGAADSDVARCSVENAKVADEVQQTVSVTTLLNCTTFSFGQVAQVAHLAVMTEQEESIHYTIAPPALPGVLLQAFVQWYPLVGSLAVGVQLEASGVTMRANSAASMGDRRRGISVSPTLTHAVKTLAQLGFWLC